MAMNQPRSLPVFAQWVLTKRIPCAGLAVLMYGLVLAFAGTLLSLPLLVLHMLTPALFALVALGGGFAFAVQVALIAGVAITLIAYGNPAPGLTLVLMYAMLPIFGAAMLSRTDGVSKSGLNLAIGLTAAMLALLLIGSAAHGSTSMDFVRDMLEPLFEASRKDGIDPLMLERIKQTTAWIFPGLTVLSLWLVWWGDVLLARNIAVFYGFFRGAPHAVSSFALPRAVAYAFAALAVAAGLLGGTAQYLASNAALVLAGLLSAQGLAVAHVWLAGKRLQLGAIVMYVMLLIQPVMVLPFALLGLLDIWFDYRRNMSPTDGGK